MYRKAWCSHIYIFRANRKFTRKTYSDYCTAAWWGKHSLSSNHFLQEVWSTLQLWIDTRQQPGLFLLLANDEEGISGEGFWTWQFSQFCRHGNVLEGFCRLCSTGSFYLSDEIVTPWTKKIIMLGQSCHFSEMYCSSICNSLRDKIYHIHLIRPITCNSSSLNHPKMLL